MLILTAFVIGLLAVLTRSALSCALVGVSIVVAFGLGAPLGTEPAIWTELAVALLGFNAGIAGPICLSFALGQYDAA